MACWFADDAGWKNFDKEWRKAMRSAGVSSFHMKDFESRYGPYEDWPNIKRVGVITRLNRIIRQHRIYGCSFSADREAFNELVTPDVTKAFAAKTVYGFGAFSCMEQLAEWRSQNGFDGPTRYLFAKLNKQGGDLDRMFTYGLKHDGMKKRYGIVRTWEKELANKVPGLQAADILAYEVNKRVVNMFGFGEQVVRKSLLSMRLTVGGRYYGAYLPRRRIRDMVRDFNAGKLTALVHP